jgi:serine/threonine-protein kinase
VLPTKINEPAAPSRVDTLPEGFVERLKLQVPEPGQIIGARYRLERSLGRGGMGQVFVAENLAIHRQVAVKVLHPHLLADAEFRSRFQREAEAVAAIDHPNVARFIDLVVGDPTFLVVEYVPGPTLSETLKDEGRIELGRALRLAVRLCWALDAVHAAGVVHRDLKPSNVILAADREHGEMPKLIDFGLAKRNQEETLTRAGQIVGTPAYMSPEQVAGREVDARSDVYSLACLVYEMVCGRPPFARADDDIQLLYKHVHDEPEAASKHAPVPPALDDVLARGLKKLPAERFSSMAELARALEACQPPPPTANAPPPARRLPTWMLGVTVAVSGMAGALGARLATRHAPAPATGATLMVLSRPAGAVVQIDGRALAEPTPAVATGLDPGDHLLRVSRDGLNPIEQHVRLDRGQRSAIEVTLPPLLRRVPLTSSPSGATVYLDDKLVPGETPVSVDVTVDEFHEVRFEKGGFEVLTKRLTPEDGYKPLDVELTPERRPRGAITIDANGAAEVWIDDGPTGFTTPTLPLRVPAGPHVIQLRDGSGGVGGSAHVDVKQGETIHLTLKAPEGKAP